MPFAPDYIVTSFKNVQRKSNAQRYAHVHDNQDYWRVGLVSGSFVGVGLNFFFPTEEEASKFSLWTLYKPQQLIQNMEPTNDAYVFEPPMISYPYKAPNFWTGLPTRMLIWESQFGSPRTGRRIHIKKPSPVPPNYNPGKPLTIIDILGTVPSAPIPTSPVITNPVGDAGDKAKNLAFLSSNLADFIAAEDAQEELDYLAGLNAPTSGGGSTVAQDQAAINEDIAAENTISRQIQDLQRLQSASDDEAYQTLLESYIQGLQNALSDANAAESQAIASLNAANGGGGSRGPETASPGFDFLGNQSQFEGNSINIDVSPGDAVWWTITQGGASGYYGLPLSDGTAILTFYPVGTFTPYNGQWYGIYAWF